MERTTISTSKQEVLDEDTYTEALSYIIERDFFPNLTKLKAQQEYLEAFNTNDLVGVQRASQILNDLQQTPANAKNSLDKSLELAQKVDLSLNLDQFQARYTSEDNASFAELMERANHRRREKYKWLYDRESATLSIEDRPEKPKEITFTDESRPASIETWKYKARNALMFYPEGFSQSEIPNEIARGAAKSISYVNTQLESNELTVPISESLPPSMQDASRGLITPWHQLAGESSASSTPVVGGYNFVPTTPTLNPDGMATPVLTWGTVEGTPLLIPGGETPGGPQFRLPPAPRREEIAMRLSEKASRNILKRKLAIGSPRSPIISRIEGPSRRAGILSPAAKNLLQKSGRAFTPSLGMDAQLRASYSSPKISSLSSFQFSHATPSPLTSRKSSHRSSSLLKSSEPKNQSKESSLTDNLLKI